MMRSCNRPQPHQGDSKGTFPAGARSKQEEDMARNLSLPCLKSGSVVFCGSTKAPGIVNTMTADGLPPSKAGHAESHQKNVAEASILLSIESAPRVASHPNVASGIHLHC